MKQFLLLVLLSISVVTTAQKQKVSLEEDTIMVDEKPYAILEKKRGLTMAFTLKSLTGTELGYFNLQEFNDPKAANNANSNGRVTYFEVTFFNDSRQCEINIPATKKSVAKEIVENGLVKENAIDVEAESKFILINGSKFTERRKALGGTVIIINN